MKIPTAEEFIYNVILKDIKEKNNIPERFHESAAKTISGYMGPNRENVTAKAMIKFAKLHVEAALEQASKVFDVNTDGDYLEHPTSERVIAAYPLSNIK